MKLLALGAFTGVVNLPSGVARVHVEKFSPGWFVAVHATVSLTVMASCTSSSVTWLMIPAWIPCSDSSTYLAKRCKSACRFHSLRCCGRRW